MKKTLSILLITVLIFTLAACQSDETKFERLKSDLTDAGYEVTDLFLDSNFKDVVSAFSFKIPFGGGAYLSAPVVLAKDKASAEANCSLFGQESANEAVQSGRIFSFYAKNYPQDYKDLIKSVIEGEEIPKE